MTEIVQIELSRDEDSVTSLGVAQSGDKSLIAYAGVNSSMKDQQAGTNEHLRSFQIDYPPKRDSASEEKGSSFSSGSTQALSKTALFKASTVSKPETYQRVLRFSPWSETSLQRIAAVATALAPDNEIVIFRAAGSPLAGDKLAQLSLGKNEAADIDIRPEDDNGDYLVAYCTDDEIYTYNANAAKPSLTEKPRLVYQLSRHDGAVKSKLKYRALRFLTQRHILLLRNRPGRTGADLSIFRLSESEDQGAITFEKQLRSSTKVATGLDVCLLSVSESGERQFVIAVAGQDLSIEVFTLEFRPGKGFSTFKKHSYFQNVHPASITSLRFSNFISPALPVTKDTRPQLIKLASTSVANTVIVHTFPLQPYPAKSRTPRYLLKPPGASDLAQTSFSVFMAILVIGIAAFFLQCLTEIRGGVPSTLGASEWLNKRSPRFHEIIARPYFTTPAESLAKHGRKPVQAAESASTLLSDLLSSTATPSSSPSSSDTASSATAPIIIVRDTSDPSIPPPSSDSDSRSNNNNGITAQLIPASHPDHPSQSQSQSEFGSDSDSETLKKFEDLPRPLQNKWKEKLKRAGHWAEDQGEAVLKGVFFSEVAGFVGGVVAGAAG